MVKHSLRESTVFDHYLKQQSSVLLDIPISIVEKYPDLRSEIFTLQQKAIELEIIQELTKKLSTSLEVTTVMQHVVEAMRKLFPTVTVAYMIPSSRKHPGPNHFYIYANYTIGGKYVEAIVLDMREQLQELFEVSGSTGGKRIIESSDVVVKFLENQNDALPEDAMPHSSVAIPMPLTESDYGLFHISAAEYNVFGEEERKMLYRIINTAVQTVNRLQQLISSEHSRTSELVESMSNGVMKFDENKHVVLVNSVLSQITGIEQQELWSSQGLHVLFEKLCGGKDIWRRRFDNAVDMVLDTSKPKTFPEVDFADKTVEMIITPVHNHDKEVVGGVITLHDITHLKEVDRMKTEFVSIASHQLRTPLTSIRLFTEMLQDLELGEEASEYLGDIHTSTLRMIGLVNNLLNVSRLEAGRLKIEPVATELNGFVHNVIRDVIDWADQFDMAIDFRSQEDEILVEVDTDLLHQVLQNLLTNAVKYTKKEGGVIDVWIEEDQLYYTIAVKDEGIGITKEDQDRMFEKFFRTDYAIKKEADGNGLGLYICKRIMEAAGGKIWFDSIFRKGSTFYVSIPRDGMRRKQGQKVLAHSMP